MLTVIGFVLMVVNFLGIHAFWRRNWWRQPLLEIDYILMVKRNPRLRNLNALLKRKGTVATLFFFFLYALGAALVIIRFNRLWASILIGLISLWMAHDVFIILVSKYSPKIRLRSYLYQPYFLAWRRDNLSEYTDEEVELAVCKACKIDPELIVTGEMDLSTFLLTLHKETMPEPEHQRYPEILEQLKSRAANLVWMG
ncbi:hypothetical protein E3J62_03140 [candidate division TA06 bacterium]|uniref:Uncharacterized protein n=1 Tax=candidate division TA06 bacterium TaxID=2250710 RepID=A0A523UWF1_UNCT6|nr:MAG: hypothetical protein E3J62_03140 [candidate division TA06 bacterium]